MGNKLIDILMETDPEKLERNSTHDIEIKRLSRVFGAPFLVTVKAVPGERYSELVVSMIDGEGSTDFSKAYGANLQVAMEGIVSPDVKNRDLQKHFGCATPKDLMEKLFNGGEITKIADTVTDMSGYGKDPEEKVKNLSTRTVK